MPSAERFHPYGGSSPAASSREQDPLGALPEEQFECGMLVDADPFRGDDVTGEPHRVFGVVAAVVEEPKWRAVDRPAARLVDLQQALVEVPVRHVAGGVPADRVLEEDGYCIDPTLVGEVPLTLLRESVQAGPLHPVVEERICIPADRDEPEVELTAGHDRLFANVQAVAWHRLGEVGGERDLPLLGQLEEVVERSEHLDVGVEVHHRALATIEQLPEQERLERGRELHDVVVGGHSEEVVALQRKALGAEDLAREVGEPVLGCRVDEQDGDRDVRMMRRERLDEQQHGGGVVARRDRAEPPRAFLRRHGPLLLSPCGLWNHAT